MYIIPHIFFIFFMEALSIAPHYLHIGHYELSQSLLTSLFGTVLFIIFLIIYNLTKRLSPQNTIIHAIDSILEYMIGFFEEVAGWKVTKWLMSVVLFVFFYILWSNLIWLFGDWFAMVLPSLHHVFRPVASDLTFNLFMAVCAVFGAIGYWFYLHGFRFIEKYIPYKWMHIVEEVNSIWTFIAKIADIALGLFIGFLELVGEFVRVASLSLRLFRNIFAGMIVMGIIITIMQDLVHAPWITPLIIFVFELMVSFIQAFVFSTLFLIYSKIATDGVH